MSITRGTSTEAGRVRKRGLTLIKLFLFLVFVPVPIDAGPLFAPAIGTEADVALHADTIWYANIQAPVMWTDLNVVGVSFVPSFSFNSAGFHGFLSAEGMIVLHRRKWTDTQIMLHAGAGLGGYRHSGLSEFVPLATFGISLLTHHVLVRLAASSMVMTKYGSNIDTFASLTIGYCFQGVRNR